MPLTQVGVKAADTQDNASQWVKDPATGEDGISKLDEASLKALPMNFRHIYIHITQERGSPSRILPELPAITASARQPGG